MVATIDPGGMVGGQVGLSLAGRSSAVFGLEAQGDWADRFSSSHVSLCQSGSLTDSLQGDRHRAFSPARSVTPGMRRSCT